MAQTPKIKMPEAGDVFIRDDLSREYTSGQITFANAGTAPVVLPAGTPLQGSTLADAATLTAADAVVLEPIIIPVGGGKVATYQKGTGVVVNETAVFNATGPALVVTNPAGSAVTYSAAGAQGLRTMWARLGFAVRAETTRQDLQTR